ncbi:PREDICTED: serine protease inhibitor Kazal-type 14 [Hipposideros armiger]|uniref:Serine protease inhibitor Kazal-type 14 n=1 Tax=Hipposideros armiger TaxID=186990 RepID=A0A8B7QNC3_HIPAR|nr:PREDICTED: serine protease inhibitor Kazal-type 14 [Hipposideros armiger]
MAKPFSVLYSLWFFILIHWALPSVSGPRHWWPSHGNIKVKCPYKKVDLRWFRGTINPCHGTHQPICGTNEVTYENPCLLCIESLKSHGKIRFLRDGKC